MAVSKTALVDLGAQIKRARGSLTLRQLETRSGVSNAVVSMWENARRIPRMDDLLAVLDALGVDDETREHILELRRDAEPSAEPGQISGGPPSIGEGMDLLIEHESHASRIVDVAPLLMPGLLQTSAYTQAVMADTPSATTRVRLRAGRREVLTGKNPVEFIALIDSEVLVRPVAPSDVMIEQLHHLLDMGARPNITIQVVPSTRPGFHPLLAGPFELIEFPQSRPIVLLEHYRSSVFLWEESDTKSFTDAAERIRNAAMTPADTARVIEDIVKGMETT
jgi:transcriptional regulator with XRE-family HTH domain